MPDDKSKTGKQDRDKFNVHEEYELRDWSKRLGVSKEELKKAVQSVENSAEAVRKHIGKLGSRSEILKRKGSMQA
jgi:hypothetical protein